MFRRLLYFSLIIGGISLLTLEELDARRGNGENKVRPHVRKNGKYVLPYRRTNPSPRQPRDNWTTRGNRNPYTGKAGTVSPYKK